MDLLPNKGKKVVFNVEKNHLKKKDISLKLH